ncbi:MAG: acetyl-CoA carboxylase biotin carboxylase subunit [Elusimicrobia bacterium]|nr:acetyl-CoA carboxylase biotin carboxylase subunit [Elusimicrobiota bacterium]
MSLFKKALVANRGEIAIRVMRTLREMGIKSAAVYSEADRNSMHLREADEAFCIGPSQAVESYLNIDAVISAARIAGADAIHPGYGFLSENPEFSRACAENKIVFIGPDAQAIDLLGHKSEARKLAMKNSVPVTPGTKDCVKGHSCEAEAEKIGFPVMIKAAAGGGGKGIRIVREKSKLRHEIQMAASEAKAAFGNGEVYLEKYIERPRHVEVQFARDSSGNAVAFPERDCSIQRRHQKLLEESPSTAVNQKLREELENAAIKLADAARYTGVGTVEFLLDAEGNFYFMEVNTRLQVEHPVTEYITRTDLVKEQVLIAAGEKLSISQSRAARFEGHAIEHRINAEDINRNFAPCPGRIDEWILPGGPGVRVDTHIYQGYTMPFYYDSMLAKLIVWAPDRPSAIARASRALEEFRVSGVSTTIDLHKIIVREQEFIEGKVDTGYIERLFSNRELGNKAIR